MTIHDHAHTAGTGCCSDTPEARARLTRARRLVALSGVAGLAVVVAGLIVGGWWGALPVILVAAGMAWPLIAQRRELSTNDRLLRVAVVVLLLGLALVRALPR